METKIFEIGGAEIAVEDHLLGFTRQWKDAYVGAVLGGIRELQDFDVSSIELMDDEGRPSADISGLIGQVLPMVEGVLGAPDMMVEAVVDWCNIPEEVVDNSRYSEYVEPFKHILSLVYPFGQMVGGLNLERIIGTKSSLPPANGGGRKKKPRPSRSA